MSYDIEIIMKDAREMTRGHTKEVPIIKVDNVQKSDLVDLISTLRSLDQSIEWSSVQLVDCCVVTARSLK